MDRTYELLKVVECSQGRQPLKAAARTKINLKPENTRAAPHAYNTSLSCRIEESAERHIEIFTVGFLGVYDNFKEVLSKENCSWAPCNDGICMPSCMESFTIGLHNRSTLKVMTSERFDEVKSIE